MTLMRVFGKSIQFTFRSKIRFLVFVLIIAIVATLITFIIDSIDTLNTDEFLEQKGVVLEQVSPGSVNYTQSERLKQDILALEKNGVQRVEEHASYHYQTLDSSLSLFSIDVNKPWMSDVVNPKFIETGRFPREAGEIIVPDGSFQYRNSSSGVILKTELVIGQTIVLQQGNTEISLEVVGTFDYTSIQLVFDVETELWLFLDISQFTEVIDMYGLDINSVNTYSMSFTVPGVILDQATYTAIDELNEEIKVLREDGSTGLYGEYRPQLRSLPKTDAIEQGKLFLTILGFAVAGGAILTMLFAYLISRFRRNEIAILKALGYSNSMVRSSLVAEILTTAFTGFFVGIFLAQGSIFILTEFSTRVLMSWQAISLSFLLNVITTLPGAFVVSRRILKVSPAEAFRDN